MADYDPRIWGAHAWKFLYSVADGFPDSPTSEDKEHYKTLYHSLQYTLPCKQCRDNYILHIKETPIDNYLKNSYSLAEWVTIIHNKTNLMLNKKLIVHEKARKQRYKHNLMLTNGRPCCGKGKGKNTQISELQRQKNIEALQKRERAKKTMFELVKKNREKRKRKRKGLPPI